MSLPTIMGAIDTQLATIDFPSARIQFLNVTYRPVAGQPFLVASMPSLTTIPLTLGPDQSAGGGAGYIQRWDGVLQVEAVWPENAGSDGCYQMQQKLLRLFPRGLTLTTSDGLLVRFDNSSPMPIRPDGTWVRGPVRCPWWLLEAT